jgi:hypothetical protein
MNRRAPAMTSWPGTADHSCRPPVRVFGAPAAGKPLIAPANSLASTAGLLGTESSGDGVIGERQ